MKLSNETYDNLKWVAQIGLPAFAAFVGTVCTILKLPHGTEIVSLLVAVDTFLGALLKTSSDEYQGDGQLIVDTSDPLKDIYSIAIDDYPEKLAEKDTVVLKVSHAAHMARED